MSWLKRYFIFLTLSKAFDMFKKKGLYFCTYNCCTLDRQYLFLSGNTADVKQTWLRPMAIMYFISADSQILIHILLQKIWMSRYLFISFHECLDIFVGTLNLIYDLESCACGAPSLWIWRYTLLVRPYYSASQVHMDKIAFFS